MDVALPRFAAVPFCKLATPAALQAALELEVAGQDSAALSHAPISNALMDLAYAEITP